MAIKRKNLSSFSGELPSAKPFKIGIVVAEWNPEITESLFNAASSTLLKAGILPKNLIRVNVPGSFELTSGAHLLAKSSSFNAIICLGCVIQGETRHFDFICEAVANGLTNLGIKHDIPFIFGVLTTNTMEQASERAGGNHGNKGDEAAITAIKMSALAADLKKNK